MSVELQSAYPGLDYLFGCYLHQDYTIFGGSVGDAVRAFARDEKSAVVAALREDIMRLRREYPGRLDGALDCLDPSRAHPPGLSAADYLRLIEALLDDSAQSRAAE